MASNTAATEHPETPRGGRKLIGDRGSHFLNKIQGETGINVSACYQCERCTNACPVSYYMDIKPHQVIRYTQLGWGSELMKSTTAWVCLSCEMCTTYCPNDIGVAGVINHLRTLAAHTTAAPSERLLAVFHETFLEELHRFGRVNELWLMNSFNLKPNILKEKMAKGLLKKEMLLGLDLWRKGRLKLIPRRSKAIQEIRSLYRQKRGEVNR